VELRMRARRLWDKSPARAGQMCRGSVFVIE